VLIRVNVDNPGDRITEFGAGAKLYWARDNASATGAFTDASGSTALVATQTQYEIIDTTGAVGHYYRTRIGNTGGTSFDTWSDVFQAGAPGAYASIDALREFLQLPDFSRDNVLSDLLARVTDKITLSLGFDFFRHPAVTGTEIRTYDGDNRSWLHVTQGINSLTLVRLAVATGYTYSSLAATDWKLRMPVQAGGPYLSLELTGVASYPTIYTGHDTLELTGVFGYLTIPAAIEQATLMWAADLYRLGAGGGSPLSATGEEFGQARFIGGMPRFTWETVEEYRKLHQGALVA
jgi:hypothetical protein